MAGSQRGATLRYPVMLADLSQGLFADRGLLDIPTAGASQCSNVVWRNGYLQPRPGFTKMTAQLSTPGPILHLKSGYDATGAPVVFALQRYAQTADTISVALHKYNGTSWTFIGITAVPLSTSQYLGRHITSCFFKYSFYFSLGTGELIGYINGSLLPLYTQQADTTKQPMVNNYVVAANDSTLFCCNGIDRSGTPPYPARIAWSNFLDAYTWGGQQGSGTSGYQDLPGGGDSSPITGMYVSNLNIMLFKARVLYTGYATGSAAPAYAFQAFLQGPGCISQATVKDYRDGKIVWLGDDNVYMGTPGEQPTPIGDKIRLRIRAVADLVDLARSFAYVDRDSDLYVLVIPNANDQMVKAFACNLRNLSWWEWDLSFPINTATNYRPGPWTSQILVGGDDGFIYVQDYSNPTDSGTSFAASWTSGIYQSRALSGSIDDQGSVQSIRAYSPDFSSVTPYVVQLGVLCGNGLDRFQSVDFGIQSFDGSVSDVYVDERPNDSENYMFTLSYPNVALAPRVNALWFSIIPKGPTR